MRRLLTLALLLTTLVFATGCFVFDELDQGQKELDAHRPQAVKQKEAEEKAKTAKSGEAPATYSQVTQAWWKDAKSLPSAPEEEADAAGNPNATVTCKHGGKTFFTRRSDCLARGSRSVG